MGKQSFSHFEIGSGMQALTDEQLMECFQINKDGKGEIALDHLYCRYAKRMINFFYFTSQNDKDHAQDLLHDLFLKVIENKTRFDINQSFKSWIYRIASNLCRNDFRSKIVHQKYHNHVKISADLISSDHESENHILRTCIKKLEHQQRSLMVLRFKLNLSIKEIADIYECPEGTIKSRLFYATRDLTELFKRHNHENR